MTFIYTTDVNEIRRNKLRIIMEKLNRTEGIQEALKLYEKPLIHFASQYVKSRHLAQDVVQDSFLKLCQADWDKVKKNVKAWLYTVCRNRSLEIIRKEKKMIDLETSTVEQRPDRQKSPDSALEQADAFGQAMCFLKTLNEKEQELIKLKYQQQLSYKEISTITGNTVSNVGFILHSALKKLRFKINCQEVTK